VTVRPSVSADPEVGLLPALLLGLTVVTGVIDAVSILSLGRVFVANMTGNVVFVGFALAGAPGFSVSAAIFALGGFLEGAVLAGAAIRRFGSRRDALFRAAVLVQLGLVVLAVVVAVAADAPYGAGRRDAIAAICALAMGIQNAVVSKLAIADLTTTVLTRTLTSIAVDLRAGGDRPALVRRVLSVLAMLAGAIVGALLVLYASPTAALGLAAGMLAIVACGAHRLTASP
jgi:uncharacterized membrane protein YoaK (UPF0700 family)